MLSDTLAEVGQLAMQVLSGRSAYWELQNKTHLCSGSLAK